MGPCIDAYSTWINKDKPFIILGNIRKSAVRRNFDFKIFFETRIKWLDNNEQQERDDEEDTPKRRRKRKTEIH